MPFDSAQRLRCFQELLDLIATDEMREGQRFGSKRRLDGCLAIISHAENAPVP